MIYVTGKTDTQHACTACRINSAVTTIEKVVINAAGKCDNRLDLVPPLLSDPLHLCEQCLAGMPNATHQAAES